MPMYSNRGKRFCERRCLEQILTITMASHARVEAIYFDEDNRAGET